METEIKNYSLKNSKILLVDDITKNLQLLGTILQEHEFQVAIAKSGMQALSIVENKPPDLILLDISMPEMDGYEVCRRLKENPETKEIPIIFLTAKTEVDDIVKGFEAGGVDYIIKPFNPKELLKRVITHLELKFSRESLKQLNSDLTKANQDKDKFLSIISHDLRSPFHGLLGIAQIVKENFDALPKEDIKEYFDLLNEGLNNQFRFLENILQWGRLQRGHFDFSPEVLNINELLTDSVTYLKINAEIKNIELTLIDEPELYCFADKNLLREIIQNLTSNALKFTKEFGKVLIKAKNEVGQIIISVKDNGIGISENNLERIFKIDQIFTTNGTRSEPGTGLGLVLCREMIEKNNGSIYLESTKGIGTEITISLPAYSEEV
jgi:two-component system, sensor histidine kinase and response regulator